MIAQLEPNSKAQIAFDPELLYVPGTLHGPIELVRVPLGARDAFYVYWLSKHGQHSLTIGPFSVN